MRAALGLIAALAAGEPAPPLSPGGVALLVLERDAAAAGSSLARSLGSGDAALRAAAARVALARDARDLVGPLRRALAGEADPAAAAEELRALLALAPPGDDAALFEAVARFEGRLDSFFVAALGHARGSEALGYLGSPDLEALHPARAAQRAFLWQVVRGRGSVLTAAARAALASNDATAFGLLVEIGAEIGASLPPDLAGPAVAHPSRAFRLPALWSTAATLACSALLEEAAARALLEAAPDPATNAATGSAGAGYPGMLMVSADEDDTIDERFARELIARALGREPRPDAAYREMLERGGRSGLRVYDRLPELLALLTQAERKTYSARSSPRGAVSPERLIAGWRAAGARRQGLRPLYQPPLVWAASGFPPGLPGSIFRECGCPTRRARDSAVASIRFGPDGRPRAIERVQPVAGPAGCERATTVLLRLGLAPDDILTLESSAESVVLLAGDEALRCAAGALEWVDQPDLRAGFEPPAIVKQQKMELPRGARERGERGSVEMGAVLDASGCLHGARIVEAPSGELGLLALLSSAEWRFAPARRHGQPIATPFSFRFEFR